MAEIMGEHLPPGVFNVICGDRDTGRTLVSHPMPQMVSITGSVRAGREVAAAAANGLKRVHLELGGKAPVDGLRRRRPGQGGRGDRHRRATSTPARTAPPPPGCWPGPACTTTFVDALVEQAKSQTVGGPDDDRRGLRAAEQRQPSSSGCPGSSSGCRTTPGC